MLQEKAKSASGQMLQLLYYIYQDQALELLSMVLVVMTLVFLGVRVVHHHFIKMAKRQ